MSLLPPGVDPSQIRLRVKPSGELLYWTPGVPEQPETDICDAEGHVLCRGGPRYYEALCAALGIDDRPTINRENAMTTQQVVGGHTVTVRSADGEPVRRRRSAE